MKLSLEIMYVGIKVAAIRAYKVERNFVQIFVFEASVSIMILKKSLSGLGGHLFGTFIPRKTSSM